jgi:hypothetical protein
VPANKGVKERLKEFIAYLGIGNREFEISIEVSNGYINSISKSIGGDKLEKISKKYPQLNREWLLFGEGDMTKPVPRFDYNAVALDETDMVMVTKSGNKLTQLTDGRYRMEIKMVEDYAQAGYLAGFSDPDFIESMPTHTIVVDEVKRGFYRAFRVVGDSMSYDGRESIEAGDIVTGRNIDQALWKSKLHLNKWKDFVIVNHEGILIKRIIHHDVENGTITLHSLNPDKTTYPDKVMHLSEVRQLFNVVKYERG